jgi:hypothetical protein
MTTALITQQRPIINSHLLSSQTVFLPLSLTYDGGQTTQYRLYPHRPPSTPKADQGQMSRLLKTDFIPRLQVCVLSSSDISHPTYTPRKTNQGPHPRRTLCLRALDKHHRLVPACLG